MLPSDYRYVKFKLQTSKDAELLQEVGSAYAQDSRIRGITVTFRIRPEKYDDFLNLTVGWSPLLRLPSAIDRAQFVVNES